MSSKQARVPRPLKKAEFDIRFGTNQAKRGWQDLLATKRNAIVDAWDFLARNPSEESSTNHRLKGELATVSREGRSHDRWQYELPGGARIWFYIGGKTVHLIDAHTHHPNETK
ncbi:hypothetical protein [Arthrobacter castelli]|uniref:hypothetical protein n=1 Tax=Arthrobacter castelli TaxID=271431 RepID=UPI0004796C52|nr:hypothetical protein [Arthrobacter castelli]